MKIGVITDVNANLPAFEKALDFFQNEGCDQIIHIGDLVGIGPYPKECLDLALSQNHIEFVMGNHDYWYAYGLPKPRPSWMSSEEVEHQKWTHSQLGLTLKNEVKHWPFHLQKSIKGHNFSFVHYGLNKEQNWFLPIVNNPSDSELSNLFKDFSSDVICYGHTHEVVHIQNQKTIINIGSAGCSKEALVRCGIILISEISYTITFHQLPYDDTDLFIQFEKRKVPARSFIKKVFMPR